MDDSPHGPAESLLPLLLADGLGSIRTMRLLEAFGSAHAAAAASPSEIAACLGTGVAAAQVLRERIRRVDVGLEREAIARHGACLVAIGSRAYPPLLAAIPDPPPLLWLQGRSLADLPPAVAVVGTRRPSVYGLEQAGRFAGSLAAAGVAIASGGARGIDAAAHRAALRVGGITVAVLGSGLACPYPPEHAGLFREIVAAGGVVVSELPMGTSPRPGFFPRRNRLISGLSRGVLVIEAGSRSGALVTARLAVEEHGREAMAVPGRIDSPTAAGCLRAIREGWAAPVASLAEVMESLGEAAASLDRFATPPDDGGDAGAGSPAGDLGLTPSQRRILQAAEGQRELSVDELVARTGLEASQVLAELTLLRLRGRLGWVPA
jgi:DNA processing protein